MVKIVKFLKRSDMQVKKYVKRYGNLTCIHVESPW
jgi:hypothetical protein